MSIPARQSTALEIAIGPVLDADGVFVTDCTAADFKIKKTTGDFAALNGSATVTHVSAGTYDVVLTTSDTDTVGLCTVAIDDTTNACAPFRFQVIEEAIYDALYAASATGLLPANVTQFGGTNGTFSSGRPEVNAVNAAEPGDQMDLVDAPNATAITAINSAVLSAISGLNNLSALANLYGAPLLEIPDAGAGDSVYAFTLVVRDNEGKLVALDSAPTITAANAAGTDRSGNLSSVSNPATGRYTFTYSVADDATAESLRITCSGAVSAEARYVEWIGAVVDYDTVTQIAAIKAKTDNLPSDPADQSAVEAAITAATSGLASQASVDVIGGVVEQILVDTAEIGAAGAGLTEAGGTGDQFTGIASVGAVAGNVGGVAGTTQTLDALATLIRGADGDTLKTISDQIDAIPTTIRVKKNAALAGFPIVMIDTSGDPATSKTVTGTVSLDGGAFAPLTNSISEVSGGLYAVNLAAGDTNGNTIVMRFSATGCRTRFVEIVTQP